MDELDERDDTLQNIGILLDMNNMVEIDEMDELEQTLKCSMKH